MDTALHFGTHFTTQQFIHCKTTKGQIYLSINLFRPNDSFRRLARTIYPIEPFKYQNQNP